MGGPQQLEHKCHGAGPTTFSLTETKIKEMLMDFKKPGRQANSPLTINGLLRRGSALSGFLDATFTTNTAAIVRRLRKAGLPTVHLTSESIMTYSLTFLFGSCNNYEKHRLNRLLKTARRIIGDPLPSQLGIYGERCSGGYPKRPLPPIIQPVFPSNIWEMVQEHQQ